MFKRYSSLKEVFENDAGTIASHISGNFQLGVFHLCFAIAFLAYASRASSKVLVQWMGGSLILCSLTRFVAVWNVWYGYYAFAAILTNIAGIVSMVAVILIIPIIRQADKLRTYYELQKDVEVLEKKLESLQEIKNENNSNTATTTDMV